MASTCKVDKTKIVRIFIAITGVFGCVWSAQSFVAGNLYYSAKNAMDEWQVNPSSASFQEAGNALEQINSALSYFPKSALYHQMKGQINEWLAYTDKEGKENYLESATVSYKTSLSLRPNWAGSWVGLATVRWKQQEIDSQFYNYLDMAIKVGPQDSMTHVFITEFGLAMLSARSVEYVKVKDRLKHHLLLGIENPLSRNRVLATIKKYNAKKTVCNWLPTQEGQGARKTLSC